MALPSISFSFIALIASCGNEVKWASAGGIVESESESVRNEK